MEGGRLIEIGLYTIYNPRLLTHPKLNSICLFCFRSTSFNLYDLKHSGDKAAHGKRSLSLERNSKQTYKEEATSKSRDDKLSLRSTASAPNQPTNKNCKPVDKVLFLKTHKTGSSTITNILNRYGDSRDLNVVLPRSTTLYTFVWPTRFRMSYTANLFGMEPNIICNHARYSRRPMHWLFPKDRSVYITILREPLWQYESVFNFMSLAYLLGYHDDPDPLATFLKFPPSGHDIRRLMKKRLALHLVRNPMLFDLGLDFRYYQNRTAVENYFDFIEQEYDLVMIMEYFDESLVLLKRTLCWDYEDILYFKLNERPDNKKRSNLTEDVKRDIKSWNRADFLLYERFNRTLWEKIEKIGPEFYKELNIFRQKKQELEKTCLEKGSYLDEAYTGVYVKGYRIKKDTPPKLRLLCERMMRNEINYVKYFRSKDSRKIWELEEPDEYLDDPKNDWDLHGSDFEHDPEVPVFNSSDAADDEE